MFSIRFVGSTILCLILFVQYFSKNLGDLISSLLSNCQKNEKRGNVLLSFTDVVPNFREKETDVQRSTCVKHYYTFLFTRKNSCSFSFS